MELKSVRDAFVKAGYRRGRLDLVGMLTVEVAWRATSTDQAQTGLGLVLGCAKVVGRHPTPPYLLAPRRGRNKDGPPRSNGGRNVRGGSDQV